MIVIESRLGCEKVVVGIVVEEFGVVIAARVKPSKLEKSTVVVARVCCALSFYVYTLNFYLLKCYV